MAALTPKEIMSIDWINSINMWGVILTLLSGSYLIAYHSRSQIPNSKFQKALIIAVRGAYVVSVCFSQWRRAARLNIHSG